MNTPAPLTRAGLALTLALGLALAVSSARAAGTLRDIYSTAPGNTGLYLTSLTDYEGGAQAVATSTSTIQSAPYALRLKFLAGVARNVVGLRFVNASSVATPMDLTAHKNTASLEFWINPKATPSVPSLAVSLVSNNGTKVETRLLLSSYLEPADYADAWSFVSIPLRHFPATGVVYGTQTAAALDWTKIAGLNFSCDTTGTVFYDPSVDDIRLYSVIDPLAIDGRQFKKTDGTAVRLWGMNLSAVYPTHTQAEGIAANLASLGINVVRPHHNMRSSLDWNTVSGIPALVTYSGNTRTPHATAWDRFDYLNAQLRAEGIYLMPSLHSSRRFLPGDVDILTTNSTDRTNWMDAMTALGSMPGNLDLFKMLPMIDERCARLMEEFAQQFLNHVNPYTGLAYGKDPQVLSLEFMNEHSSEYAIFAGNKFESATYPKVSYWTTVLQTKWDAYTASRSLTACPIYAPPSDPHKLARGDFLRGLDQAYFNRIKTYVRALGCQTPVMLSNLWRGEAFQKQQESLSDLIEDHSYGDPYVPRAADDIFNPLSRSTPTGKPYIVGELNQAADTTSITANSRYRTTLPVAAATYGAFNSWSGVVWFAWAHGDSKTGADGWATVEERTPASTSDRIGQLQCDGMMLDHLRTTGIIFRRGLASPSSAPITLYANDPLATNGYSALVTPKYQFVPGWQSIHAVRRAFGPVPAAQPTSSWMTTTPASPLISDTNEIRKDTTRQQLTFSTAFAEAFSGKLDLSAPAGLTRIGLVSTSGFATVVLVSNDSIPIATSNELVISRTYLDATTGAERVNQPTKVSGLKTPATGFAWHIKVTRPRGSPATYQALTPSAGVLTLPSTNWKEAELKYAQTGTLP
jgi:hypothetical protein